MIARCIRLAAAASASLIVFVLMVLIGTPTVTAAPTDTVLPVPVVGLATGPTGLGGPLVAQHLTVTTDTDTPGLTRFAGTERPCACMIHWRNLTTGDVGSTNLWFGPSPHGDSVETGAGLLIATVTASGAVGPITFVPGAGFWFVP